MSEHTVDTALAAMKGVRGHADIAAERFRQVLVLGYDVERDRRHSVYDLVAPAIVLLGGEASFALEPAFALEPEDARSDLVRAGALIAAAIDRLDENTALERAVKRPTATHTVEVTLVPSDFDDLDPAVRLQFTCGGDRDSDCHYYRSCDPEVGTCEHPSGWPHPRTEHDECWVTSWFAIPEALEYVGPDARSGLVQATATRQEMAEHLPPAEARTGEVTVHADPDYLEWSWTEDD